VVRHADSGLPIAGARVCLQTGPNDVTDFLTVDGGTYRFTGVGKGTVVLSATAHDCHRCQMTFTVDPTYSPKTLDLLLRPAKAEPHTRVKITGIEVRLVDETYEERDAQGKLVTPEDYLIKVRQEVLNACHSMIELQTAWTDRHRREELLTALESRLVHLDIVRAILQRPDADSFDLLAHVGFGAAVHSREERANALFTLHREFLESFDTEARSVLSALIEKYRYGGVLEVSDPQVFALAPFHSDLRRVARVFSGVPALRRALDEMIRRLYTEEAA